MADESATLLTVKTVKKGDGTVGLAGQWELEFTVGTFEIADDPDEFDDDEAGANFRHGDPADVENFLACWSRKLFFLGFTDFAFAPVVYFAAKFLGGVASLSLVCVKAVVSILGQCMLLKQLEEEANSKPSWYKRELRAFGKLRRPFAFMGNLCASVLQQWVFALVRTLPETVDTASDSQLAGTVGQMGHAIRASYEASMQRTIGKRFAIPSNYLQLENMFLVMLCVGLLVQLIIFLIFSCIPFNWFAKMNVAESSSLMLIVEFSKHTSPWFVRQGVCVDAMWKLWAKVLPESAPTLWVQSSLFALLVVLGTADRLSIIITALGVGTSMISMVVPIVAIIKNHRALGLDSCCPYVWICVTVIPALLTLVHVCGLVWCPHHNFELFHWESSISFTPHCSEWPLVSE